MVRCGKAVDDVGVVVPSDPTPRGEPPAVCVHWIRSDQRESIRCDELRGGFRAGWEVQDVPRSRTRRSLGTGSVVATRTIGGRDQVLVYFDDRSDIIWIPFENLRRIRGVRERFLRSMIGPSGHAERFRLKTLAYALERWNANTGALSHLDIDPLPHQIHLVHHILASGNLNWLIADDVGLGKTIETGMLISALHQRGQCKRVLMVTPAGVTRQWQEEMRSKFRMTDFEIYGHDFEIHEASRWKLHDRVIVSVDRLKGNEHLQKMRDSEAVWDLIVFDEAHRLTRRQWGAKFTTSERFKLAAALRELSDNIVLLSGTPHQGKSDQFGALLELLRPELKEEIERVDVHPEILSEMVYRNRKIDVTDADGGFIFHGKQTLSIPLEVSDKEKEFDKALQQYIKAGYSAADEAGNRGKAIGFVMTVYRKLASSSVAAIAGALERRLDRLHGRSREPSAFPSLSAEWESETDSRFQGEAEETRATSDDVGVSPFFENEIKVLTDLIRDARELAGHDRKLGCFIDDVLPLALRNNTTGKVLIFSEYRQTQDVLRQALAARYGEDRVVLINGSQSIDEKQTAIQRFEGEADFLVSTEAGGEGLNLHHGCHVLVNYDLPWNPMRLVQRVGRLYRYGQRDRVIVLNLHAPQTIDAKVVEMMYQRLDVIVDGMSTVSGEFNEGLHDEIMGQLASLADLEDLILDALTEGIARSEERIGEALRRAADARELQENLLRSAQGFDRDAAVGELALGPDHVHSFVVGMFRALGVEILSETRNARVMDIRLPADLAKTSGVLRMRLRVTTDRNFARGRASAEMLDFGHPLFQTLVRVAQSHAFGGLTGIAANLPSDVLIPVLLRWQDDQGRVMREQIDLISCRADDAPGATIKTELNAPSLSDWLLSPAPDGGDERVGGAREAILSAASQAADQQLSNGSKLRLHPLDLKLIGTAWRGNKETGRPSSLSSPPPSGIV